MWQVRLLTERGLGPLGQLPKHESSGPRGDCDFSRSSIGPRNLLAQTWETLMNWKVWEIRVGNRERGRVLRGD